MDNLSAMISGQRASWRQRLKHLRDLGSRHSKASKQGYQGELAGELLAELKAYLRMALAYRGQVDSFMSTNPTWETWARAAKDSGYEDARRYRNDVLGAYLL